MLIKIADAYPCNKKTYNNAVSALRRAFDFGYLDYPERRDPAASLKCTRIGKNDRPAIDNIRTLAGSARSGALPFVIASRTWRGTRQ